MLNDIFNGAWRELRQKPVRSLAVIAGYMMTVVIMLVTTSVLLLAKTAENSVIGQTGTHFVTWMPSCGDISSLSEDELAKLAKGIIPAKCQELCQNCTGCNKKPIDLLNEGFIINTNTTRLLALELIDRVKKLPAVRDASGYLLFRFRDPLNGRLFVAGGLNPGSTAARTTCCAPSDLISGEYLTASMTGSVMLEHSHATANNLHPGSTFVIAGEEFKVAGVVNTGVRPGKADLYMLFNDAERVINRRIQNPLFQEANVILVESSDAAHHDQAIAEVKSLVMSEAIISYGCYKTAAEAVGLNERSVWLFLILVAAGAVIFAMRTQWASAIERRRSIAILKAIGWTDRVIMLQLLCESLLQALTGCSAGVLASAVLLQVVPFAALLGIESTGGNIFSLQVAAILTGFGIAAGLLAGLLPVVIAIRQRPAELLRRC